MKWEYVQRLLVVFLILMLITANAASAAGIHRKISKSGDAGPIIGNDKENEKTSFGWGIFDRFLKKSNKPTTEKPSYEEPRVDEPDDDRYESYQGEPAVKRDYDETPATMRDYDDSEDEAEDEAGEEPESTEANESDNGTGPALPNRDGIVPCDETCPTLTNGNVTPTLGGNGQTYRFKVTYADDEGDSPDIQKVWLDNVNDPQNAVSHNMIKISGDHQNGAVYEYVTPLGSGFYKYKFEFSDTANPSSVYLGYINGPDVSNAMPVLTSANVTPIVGTAGVTVFTYSVNYSDWEGNAPDTYLIYIDGTPHQMTKTSGNYNTGAKYEYQTTLGLGAHNYYFEFSDPVHVGNIRLLAAGAYPGPSTGDVAPVINSVTDVPDPANQGAVITITANVTDNLGVKDVLFSIDGGVNASPTGSNGEIYWYTGANTAVAGQHTYTVYADDNEGNDAVPVAGTYNVTDITIPVINSAADDGPVNQGGVLTIIADVTDDAGVHTVTVDINGVNHTMNPAGGNAYMFNGWNTNVPHGIYNYIAYANDTTGNNAVPVGGNFAVADVVIPVINSVTNNGPVNQGAVVTIIANVTDNEFVDTVLVEVNGANNTMTPLGGDLYQFNCADTANAGAQGFTVYANDTSGSNAVPVASAFTVIDITGPNINAVADAPDPVARGAVITITSDVTDNVAVNTVLAEVNGINYTMNPAGGNTYSFNGWNTNVAPGNYAYIVHANDTLGNNAVPQAGAFAVIDNVIPVINWARDAPDPVNQGAVINITANVTDDVGVDGVFFSIDGGANASPTGNAGELYWYTGANTAVSGAHTYTVYANDTSGGQAVPANGNFAVNDNTNPVINSISDAPDPVNQGAVLNITADATDNVAVDTVLVEINGVNYTMNPAGGNKYTYLGWNTNVAVGPYGYTVYANDTTGNNALTLNGQINVRDAGVPVINSVSDVPDPVNQGAVVNITANVTDNIAVDIVLFNIGGANATPTGHAGDLYWYTGAATNNLGVFQYIVYANDTAGNEAVPQIGTYTVVDTTPPAAVTGLGETSIGLSWIQWNWTNPVDADFDHIEVYIDGVWKTNTSAPGYNATGLNRNTAYEIGTRTVDNASNINTTWANDTATTHIEPVANFTYTPANPTTTDNITFNASRSSDPDGNIVTYTWDFGDGKTTTGITTNHTYAANNTYTVTLTVTDNHGHTNAMNKNFAVILPPNKAPNANAGPDITANEGQTITLNGTKSNDTDGNIVSYNWTYGDGNTGTGNITTHTYGDDAVYTVTLNVTDDDGNWTTDTATITINNINATVNAGLDQTINLSSPTITLKGNFTDPGWNDTHNATWNWGDASTSVGNLTEENIQPDATGNVTNTHTYVNTGVYTITLTVDDDDTGRGDDTLTITILDNIPPATVTGLGETSVGTTWIQWNWTNPVDADFNHIEVYINGTWQANISAPGYNTTGLNALTNYWISTKTTDNTGNINTTWVNDSAITLALPNIPPVADAGPNQTCEKNIACTLNGTNSTDADGTIVAYNWTLGDGNNGTGNLTTHTYTATGAYTANLTVTDDDGATDWDTALITVVDTTAPATVTGLGETSVGLTWIQWNWTNPVDADFDHIEVYIDGVWKTNTSAPGYNATGLNRNTAYEIGTRTVDNASNINTTWANDTATTHIEPVANFTYTPANPTTTDNITFNASRSSDPDGNIVTYAWDFGDGKTTTGITTNHTYAANNTYTVTLTVNDNHGHTAGMVKAIGVNLPPNVAPVADAGLNQAANEGATVTFNGTNSTDSDGNIVSYNWTFGDGTTGNGNITTHTYGDNGVYTATLNVTDNDGNWTTDTATITINNINATVNAGLDQTINLSSPTITLRGNFTDPGWNDTHNATWNWGDASTSVGNLTEENIQPDATGNVTNTHTYVNTGVYTITLTVDDDDTGRGDDTLTITILDNIPPATVTGLGETSVGTTWIQWNWTNPENADFNHTEVYINGTWAANVSTPGYNATGLAVNTTYMISTRTTDNTGNVNLTWVNDTAKTLAAAPGPGNNPPVANITSPVAGTYNSSTVLMFNGSASYDPDGDNVTYAWASSKDGALSINATFSTGALTIGAHNITLTVDDGKGGVGNDVRALVIRDATAPVIHWISNAPRPVNRNSMVNLTANVTDNVVVDSVLFEVGGVNYTANKTGDVYWFTGANTTVTGIFNLTVHANDTAGNWAATVQGDYFVVIPPQPPGPSGGGGLGGRGPPFMTIARQGEICDDGEDNDLDGLIDCEDQNCANNQTCIIEVEQAPEEETRPSIVVDLNFTANESIALFAVKGDEFTFMFKGEIQTIIVSDVKHYSVIMALEGEPEEFTIERNETMVIDIDEDGIDDLEITLNGVTERTAQITFTRLWAVGPTGPTGLISLIGDMTANSWAVGYFLFTAFMLGWANMSMSRIKKKRRASGGGKKQIKEEDLLEEVEKEELGEKKTKASTKKQKPKGKKGKANKRIEADASGKLNWVKK